ncbi:outer membrane protein assembly factor BamB [Marinicella sp. S1101]|uniref:outer membrane protein assembly factor BamB n=1 Tax=Marinicella marina TaxID=2996016 RepID=UPI002260EF04|nr:outer membrane protein assembly factor BamB [Marinicella marina]MCX7553621.1 outer membrane protein assembly factor BamB [Marinicella marina]MDJ1140245.1 outer membrane protein assembly factor BamB [Marinicella marina]
MKRFPIYLLLLLLVACSNKKDEVKPNELVDLPETGSIKTLWKLNLESSERAYGYKLIPAEKNGALLLATQQGEVYSLDAKTGVTNWQTNIAAEISAGPGVGDTILVLGGPEGQVVALDIDTGTEIWRTNVTSEVLSPPVIDRNKVVVRTQDGRIYGFSIQTGQREWSFDTNIPNLTLRGNSTPIAKGGRVYVGFDNGRVAALNIMDGSVLWQQNVINSQGKTEIDRIADIDGDIGVIATDLYLSSAADKTMSVATESGRALWSQNIGSVTGVTVSRRSLFLTDNQSVVHQLNRTDGSKGWSQDALLNRELTKPSFYLGDLLVGDFEGYVHILDGVTGEVINRVRVGDDRFYHAPVVVGDVIYTYNHDGTVVAMQYSK